MIYVLALIKSFRQKPCLIIDGANHWRASNLRCTPRCRVKLQRQFVLRGGSGRRLNHIALEFLSTCRRKGRGHYKKSNVSKLTFGNQCGHVDFRVLSFLVGLCNFGDRSSLNGVGWHVRRRALVQYRPFTRYLPIARDRQNVVERFLKSSLAPKPRLNALDSGQPCGGPSMFAWHVYINYFY